MRTLALDVGEVRIGVALSDPLGYFASPLTTIVRGEESEDMVELARLAAENEVGEIVVGLPLSMSGRKSEQTRITERFAKALAEAVSVPVHLVDERLSSVQAERMIGEFGGKPSEDRGRVDATAAAVVLQAYLDAKKYAAS